MKRFRKALPRMFFTAAVAVMVGTSFRIPVAQAQPEDTPVLCADGNRALCERGKLPGGGEYFKYYV